MLNWNNLIVDILIPNHEVTRKFLMLYRKDGFKRQAIIKVLLAITLNSKLENFIVDRQEAGITFTSAFGIM